MFASEAGGTRDGQHAGGNTPDDGGRYRRASAAAGATSGAPARGAAAGATSRAPARGAAASPPATASPAPLQRRARYLPDSRRRRLPVRDRPVPHGPRARPLTTTAANTNAPGFAPVRPLGQGGVAGGGYLAATGSDYPTVAEVEAGELADNGALQ